ncbi:MAG: hypothetical protein ACTSUE_02115 [Promethearchaeota archaeon]
MRANRTIALGSIFTLLAVSVLATATTSAIGVSQATYSNDFVWVVDRTLNYSLSYSNSSPYEDLSFNTTEISANVHYKITEVNSTHANITETISNIFVDYANDSTTNSPFIALYNETTTLKNYVDDMLRETTSNNTLEDVYVLLNASTTNITITNLTKEVVPNIVNNFSYNRLDNTITANGEVINKIMVSSDISGAISSMDNSTKYEKLLGFGFLYTPMAFEGHNGTFWMNLGVNMDNITKLGLWADYDYSMTFRENETYSYTVGYTGDKSAFRWLSKFEVGYPKVGTWEKSQFDSETGILIQYETEQTRMDFTNGTHFWAGVKPTKYEMNLIYFSELLPSNATPKIPGYPFVIMLVSMGIAFALLAKRVLRTRQY